MKCGICRRDRNQEDMKHIVLTTEERAFVKRAQGVDATEYWYCKPCFSVLSDREQGAQLIKGTLQVNLAAAGNPNAQKIAQKMYDRLIDRSAKKEP
jgi:hypothetical protein